MAVSEGGAGTYLAAVALGACAGILHVEAGDLLLTALVVLASTMLLGALRPHRPWRWIVIVGGMVPLAQLLAFLLLSRHPYRSQVYESFLGLVTGAAGAYGGAAGRRAVSEIFRSR